MFDTNVVLSACLKRGPSYLAVQAVRQRLVRPLYDERVLAEYWEVVFRDEFADRITPANVDPLLRLFRAVGEHVDCRGVTLPCALPDPDDAPFAEVALAGAADALVTNNSRHFPSTLGVCLFRATDLLRALGRP